MREIATNYTIKLYPQDKKILRLFTRQEKKSMSQVVRELIRGLKVKGKIVK